ncbi:hypothetical protein MKZ24_07225 [Paenibacillus sp. FSL R7-0297]|uniref:hypothetical protein n=1 Tax=Paenibacillus sp. FSL R7-0297 TaxID=2921680 RepID=UPI0030FC4FB2
MLDLSLKKSDFMTYLLAQINHVFPDKITPSGDPLFKIAFDIALDRTYYCFKHINMPAFNKNGITTFSHLHSDQYTMFLWFLSSSLWQEYEDEIYAKKFFYLNRVINSFLCMYDTKLPEIFLIHHGIGTTLGKASYSNFFVCCQGATVGAHHGQYPVIGKGVSLLPNSSVIGRSNIEDGVSIGANCMLYEKDVERQSVVFNESGCNKVKKKEQPWAQKFFTVPVI